MIPFEHGVYRTAPRRIGLFARWFPSLAFYPRFAATVWSGGRRAKRSQYGDRDWVESSHRILQALEAVGVQFEITGVDHLRGIKSPFVVVGNHMSTLETTVLPAVIQPIHAVTFVVKASLVDFPVFKHIMRSRNPIAVSQTNPREDLKTMLVEGADRLAQGTSVVVFPEGTRMRSFDAAQFNTIGVKLAHRSGVPLVPLALKTDAWSLGRVVADLGAVDPTKKVRIAFGEPLQVTGRGTDEHRAVIDFIETNLRAWEAEDRQQGVGDPLRAGSADQPLDHRSSLAAAEGPNASRA